MVSGEGEAMITLEADTLVFRCPEVHPKAQFSLSLPAHAAHT
jgi:hypothetical protein